jgi:hypothetical protein
MMLARLSLGPGTGVGSEDVEEFRWSGVPASDSFVTSFGPDMALLGRPTALNADLVRLAVLVWAVDRSERRSVGRSNWRARDFHLEVPVSDPDAWNSIERELSRIVRFLSGDSWTFTFTPVDWEPAGLALDAPPSRLLLVSGGADSAVGAATSLAHNSLQQHAFVSHSSSPGASSSQTAVLQWVDRVFPETPVESHRINLRRRATRADGTRYQKETSSRTRSLLFIALGLATGSSAGVPLFLTENGFASINPPLTPERLGVLSTRTTHPWFLRRLGSVLSSIGAHSDVSNPSQLETKGEMYRRLAVDVGEGETLALLAGTNSCSHTDMRNIRNVTGNVHCGTCYGCVVRRASFLAASLPDPSDYLSEHRDHPAHVEFARKKSVLTAVEDFTQRPIVLEDLGPGLRDVGLSISDLLDVCRRGQAELKMLVT